MLRGSIIDERKESSETERVNLEHFLDIFFRSNVLIIEVLFGVVLGGVIFLTIRWFTQSEDASSSTSLQSLEQGLKKILENYSGQAVGGIGSSEKQASADVAPGVQGNAENTALIAQIEDLRNQLLLKNEEIEQIKANPISFETGASSPPSSSEAPPVAVVSAVPEGAGDMMALQEKIRDLEAKLSEYAIIEDDIADLSFYKEENVRLQKEIDRLKDRLAKYESSQDWLKAVPKEGPIMGRVEEGEAAKPSIPDFSTHLDSFVNSTPAKMKSAEEQEQGGAAEGVQTLSPETAAQAAALVENLALDEDVMAEFERAVAEQKAMEAVEDSANPGNPELASQETSDDSINLDKMMSEVQSFPLQDGAADSNALEQDLDTDKLLEEATSMGEGLSSEADSHSLKKQGA